MQLVESRLRVGEHVGDVSTLLLLPPSARSLLVMAHGAGAGMRHRTMEAICRELAGRDIATFRYQFPYMEAGSRRPNPPGVLVATVRAAVTEASRLAPERVLFAGGKSMGGRMTSTAAASSPLPGIRGLVFFGFPLHASGKPDVSRAEHLRRVTVPMLFLQGTRDSLANIDLIKEQARALAPLATLHVLDGADHSFHVLKRSHRTDEQVLDEIGAAVDNWMTQIA